MSIQERGFLPLLPRIGRMAVDDHRPNTLAPKDLLKGVVTVVVPAPEEPVNEMIGCLADMSRLPLARPSPL